jgi:hypothetical protein
MSKQRCTDANIVPIRIVPSHLSNDKFQVRNVLQSIETKFAIHVWGTVKDKMVFTVKSALCTISTGLILSSSCANAASSSAQMAGTPNPAAKGITRIYDGSVFDQRCPYREPLVQNFVETRVTSHLAFE